MTCYRCNKPLTDEEWQHYMPFDFCTKCKKEVEAANRKREHLQAVLPIFWTMKPIEQEALRSLIEEVTR